MPIFPGDNGLCKFTDITEVPRLAVGWFLSACPDGLCVLFEVDSEYVTICGLLLPLNLRYIPPTSMNRS